MMLFRCIVAWLLVVLFSLPVPLFMAPDFDEDERIYASEISLSSKSNKLSAQIKFARARLASKPAVVRLRNQACFGGYASKRNSANRIGYRTKKIPVLLRKIAQSSLKIEQLALGKSRVIFLDNNLPILLAKVRDKIGEQFWSLFAPAIKEARSLLWQMSRQVQKLLVQKKARYFRKSLLFRIERIIEAEIDS